MRSEEEIRKRLDRLERRLREEEQLKVMLENKGLNADACKLYINELRERIRILKWVLEED